MNQSLEKQTLWRSSKKSFRVRLHQTSGLSFVREKPDRGSGGGIEGKEREKKAPIGHKDNGVKFTSEPESRTRGKKSPGNRQYPNEGKRRETHPENGRGHRGRRRNRERMFGCSRKAIRCVKP